MVSPLDSDSIPDLESLSFEDAFQRLLGLVEALEQGGLPLAQTSAMYQQGMGLVQRCNELLSQTELKITQLHDSYAAQDADLDEPV